MRKTLSIFAALTVVAAIAAVWSGCTTRSYKEDRPLIYNDQQYNTEDTSGRAGRTDVPRYTQREEAPPAPAPAPKPMAKAAPPAKAARVEASNEFALQSDLLRLVKRVPAKATIGQTVENDIEVTPLANCANVVITDTIPDGATFVKSDPATQPNGRKLTWTMDTLDKGSTVTIKVWFKADREGDLVNCATMAAIPRGCAVTVVGKAVISIQKSGAATAKIGQTVTYTIVVKNTGSAAAEDVVVTDNVPDGLSSADGQKTLTFNVGALDAGQTKEIAVPLKAEKRGKFCNAAIVKTSNAGEDKAEACTVVLQPGLAITKEGTKQQFLGRTASYDIVVSNTGDTDLQNVVVTDSAPADTRIVKAEDATVTGNTAVWKMATLAKGAKQTLNLVLTTGTAGNKCNAVAVTSADGLTANAQACTVWKGVPAILLETKDDPDPIGLGETVTYTIRVTNQGTADDKNIKVVATFAKEIDPVNAANGTVNGKTVTFVPVPTLAPKQVVTYTITAKGVAAGDHRLKVDLTSDMLTEPVTHEESTHVY